RAESQLVRAAVEDGLIACRLDRSRQRGHRGAQTVLAQRLDCTWDGNAGENQGDGDHDDHLDEAETTRIRAASAGGLSCSSHSGTAFHYCLHEVANLLGLAVQLTATHWAWREQLRGQAMSLLNC